MKEYYAKIKPCCSNCKCWRSIQLGEEKPIQQYCGKLGYGNPLPDEDCCDEFEFDCNVIRPTIVRSDYLIKDNQGYIHVKPLKI